MQISKPHDNQAQCSPNTFTLNAITLQVSLCVRVCWVLACVCVCGHLFAFIFNCCLLLCLPASLTCLKTHVNNAVTIKPWPY